MPEALAQGVCLVANLLRIPPPSSMPFIPRAMALVFLVTLRSLNFEHIVIFLVLAIDEAADELRCSLNSNLLYGAGIRPAP